MKADSDASRRSPAFAYIEGRARFAYSWPFSIGRPRRRTPATCPYVEGRARVAPPRASLEGEPRTPD